MARLPGTAEELRNMRTALAAPVNSIFLGPAATEAQFRSMDLSGVRILALATHGLLAGDIDGAGEPGLVFTPPAEPSEQDDGFLTASEVAALRLNADWVILSACNTAAGDGSEGAPGLSDLPAPFSMPVRGPCSPRTGRFATMSGRTSPSEQWRWSANSRPSAAPRPSSARCGKSGTIPHRTQSDQPGPTPAPGRPSP
jgi:hypothetical protein